MTESGLALVTGRTMVRLGLGTAEDAFLMAGLRILLGKNGSARSGAAGAAMGSFGVSVSLDLGGRLVARGP